MRIDCKKLYRMDYSLFDNNVKLRMNECFNLSQNSSTEYFKRFNKDNIYIKNKYNAVWVASKIKIHIFKNPNWLDVLTGDSFASLIRPIKIETETKFTNQNNELIFVANQQSCLLDIESRKLRKLESVDFPTDLEVDNTLFEEDYQKLNDKFDENDFVYEQKVFSQDIDFSNHVNNAVYVKYIMNSLTSGYLDDKRITDVEVHYIAESREGQALRIYKKELENNTIRFLIKENDREIIRASIIYV